MRTTTGGTTTAIHQLDEYLKATSTFWQDQFSRWTGIIEKVREGSYDTTQWMQDVVGMWDALADLALFPLQCAVRQAKLLPTLLFIVDEEAEFSPPGDAPINIFLPPGVTTEVSDLYRVGDDKLAEPPAQFAGNRTISAQAHIQARLLPGGDRVEVTLVDLGKGKQEREKKGIYPGIYLGAMSAREGAESRPLALICARFKEYTEDTSREESTLPEDTWRARTLATRQSPKAGKRDGKRHRT